MSEVLGRCGQERLRHAGGPLVLQHGRVCGCTGEGLGEHVPQRLDGQHQFCVNGSEPQDREEGDREERAVGQLDGHTVTGRTPRLSSHPAGRSVASSSSRWVSVCPRVTDAGRSGLSCAVSGCLRRFDYP
ncbi:hypothetical protein [Streptomyces sp. NPDC001492]